MARLRLSWVLSGRGWVDSNVGDHHSEAEVTASCITHAPEDPLAAVTRLIAGETDCRAQLEALRTAGREHRGDWAVSDLLADALVCRVWSRQDRAAGAAAGIGGDARPLLLDVTDAASIVGAAENIDAVDAPV
ncbi:hypothetical protein [Streptomyces broussonetiae]|uniref:Uncharacterized protein n=1 Tax=Streptomyces broussonetiae TaxID=2686304 RepID=A0A6I6NC23_9ACTN|nr:hypothetical protein [Streptomyces broussonetiae]QHA08964.1 hypothetical protein GQF42_42130 [Streptomyces broussonetiae]